MLSATNTVTDVRAKLKNAYSFYGYTEQSQFDSDIALVGGDIYRLYFLPRIGASEYTRIAAKDRAGLSTLETYLYWAEVYAICFEFLKDTSAQRNQLQDSGSEMLRVEGYTYQTGSGGSRGGSTNGDIAVGKYYNKMYKYFSLAGINISSIQRTCTIFEGGNRQKNVVLNVDGVIIGVEDYDAIV
jgi:hypothetical protein